MLKMICFKKSIIYLLIANILDLIFTYYGLVNNIIEEANPWMRTLYYFNPYLFCILKLFLSILSLYFIGYGLVNFKFTKYLIIAPITLYSYVIILHFYWFISYVLFSRII